MIKFEFEEEIDTSKTSSLWVEKYRPCKLEDFIGNDTLLKSIKSWIDKKEIPQLLLYGSPGTGKTSLAKLLIKNIPCDSLMINASDETGIDSMRNKVQEFAMTVGFQPLKIILLDEFERLSPEAQCLLKNLMETYSDTVRFILTSNHQDKVIEAIRSRCQSFEVKPIDKVLAMKHLIKILNLENISFKNESVAFVVKSYFPDLRKIINYAQQCIDGTELKISNVSSLDYDYKLKLVELIKQSSSNWKAFSEIRQLVADASFSNYSEVYKYLFEVVDTYSGEKSPDVILLLADAVYQNTLVFEREITFVATIHRIIKAIK